MVIDARIKAFFSIASAKQNKLISNNTVPCNNNMNKINGVINGWNDSGGDNGGVLNGAINGWNGSGGDNGGVGGDGSGDGLVFDP